jgi:hypothetical protein
MAEGYQSSEELQRHNSVFTDKSAEKVKSGTTESDKFKRVLDKYISKHSLTKNVRALAKENKRTADYQLDLSADLVLILEKIKSELR